MSQNETIIYWLWHTVCIGVVMLYGKLKVMSSKESLQLEVEGQRKDERSKERREAKEI